MQSRLDLPNGEALWENVSFIVSLFVSIAVFSDVLERCPGQAHCSHYGNTGQLARAYAYL